MKSKKLLSRATGALLMSTLLCFSLTACSKSNAKDTVPTKTAEVSTKKNSSNPITIKYVGNSCFYITFSDGTRLVTDPYGSSYATYFGEFPKLTADVITISHYHSDHTAGIPDVSGSPKIIQPEDLNKTIKVGNVEITGYPAHHVANMGDNTIFVYKADGFKIVHMGETDNIDSKEAQDAVKDADVILAYAGEYGVVKNKANFEALNKLNIKVMIPQHYNTDTENIFYGQPTLEQISAELPQGTKITKANEFVIKKDMEKQFVALTSINHK